LAERFLKMGSKTHSNKYLLFPENIGKHLTIDETSLSHGEPYTILNHKSAKRKKGCIVAIVDGTKAKDVIKVIEKTPLKRRKRVTVITLNMATNLELIAEKCFNKASRITNRFHVQQQASDALEEI
jgi:transposase